MEIGVLATYSLRLFPQETCFSLQCFPIPSNQFCSSLICDQSISVHTPAIDVAVRSWNTVASHDQHHQVQCAGLLAEEVISGVVGGSCLRNLAIGTRLEGMNEVREKDRIVDEEDWGVDANNISRQLIYCSSGLGLLLTKVSFISVEPSC